MARASEPGEPCAPHQVGGEAVDYHVVIPTRGRWKAASQISRERSLKKENRPFILVKTLDLLQRQRIPAERVSLFLADDEELARYQEALQHGPWQKCSLRVGKPGILAQRNHIVQCFEEGTYLVSLDDDLSEIYWYEPGASTLTPLPEGCLEALIYHGHSIMRENKAFIWGLNPSMNIRNLWCDGISCRNGEINGFCYGFLNRHKQCLQPVTSDAIEDAERSLRFFKEDRIILRYRMYTGATKCFKFEEGLQKLFEGESLRERQKARKAAEEEAAEELRKRFPELLLPSRDRKTQSTLVLLFRPLGRPPLPVTTLAKLRQNNQADQQRKQAAQGSGNRAKRRRISEILARKEAAAVSDDEAEALPDSQVLSDTESEPGRLDGHGENETLEALAAGADDEESLRRAIEESKESLDYKVQAFNGDVADPLEEAKLRSEQRVEEEADAVLAQLLEMGFDLDSAQQHAASGLDAALSELLGQDGG